MNKILIKLNFTGAGVGFIILFFYEMSDSKISDWSNMEERFM